MVNYLYDLNTIEANHEAFANQGVVAASTRYSAPTPRFPLSSDPGGPQCLTISSRSFEAVFPPISPRCS